jgi:hypothetical protein
MPMRALTLLLLAVLVVRMSAQSTPSLQGVWRPVEITITDSPAGRRDPFGAFPAGTHTRSQPSLMIFTQRHYSRTTDTAAERRPTGAYKTPGKPTVEELLAEWGPFAANAGTYEVSGTTVTLYAVVAKNPRAQSEKNFTKLSFKLDGNTLWLTPMETEAGPIPNPVMSKYMRVE